MFHTQSLGCIINKETWVSQITSIKMYLMCDRFYYSAVLKLIPPRFFYNRYNFWSHIIFKPQYSPLILINAINKYIINKVTVSLLLVSINIPQPKEHYYHTLLANSFPLIHTNLATKGGSEIPSTCPDRYRKYSRHRQSNQKCDKTCIGANS